MREIFDINKLPNRRLSVRNIISLRHEMKLGEAIRIVKANMARNIAEKILESKDFFWESVDSAAGYDMLEYGADCIVLKIDELAEIKREAFNEGLRHAQGFMSARL